MVDERGTSSTCPRCGSKVTKPKGRTFRCPSCTLVAHRYLVGAANIAPRGSRGGLPLTSRGWRSCTVELVGTCPAGPGVIHGASRWITTVENEWIYGRLWPAPRPSGSRSVGSLLWPERGTANRSPKEGEGLRAQH
ncbi:MAG: zinc ribbon domain-containing protein [Acidimicrobiales bacterium]